MEPSVYSNNVPCFCITLKNLTITLELGRIRTWRFPAFSALLMEFSASLRTLVLTILPNCRFSTRWWEVRYLAQPGEIYVSFREQWAGRVPLAKGSSAHIENGGGYRKWERKSIWLEHLHAECDTAIMIRNLKNVPRGVQWVLDVRWWVSYSFDLIKKLTDHSARVKRTTVRLNPDWNTPYSVVASE